MKSKNRARCKKCSDIIESKYRHDFVSCKCGAIFVDGGNDYWRCGATISLDNILRYKNRKWVSQYNSGVDSDTKLLLHSKDPSYVKETFWVRIWQKIIGDIKNETII